jgi:hypothetical protein
MARKATSPAAAKRARKPKDNSGAASLIEALKFIALAQQKEGTPPQTHCAISGGRIVAFDGTIAAGHLIEDDLHACPHTMRLLDALAKCGANLSITQLDSGRLSIKSERFKAFVPCIEFEQLSAATLEPDAPCAAIDDRIKAGFELVSPLISESAPKAMLASALLQANSIVGTNGHVLIEYWHGIDLPPNLLIPKAAINAIVKTPKKLARFGFSPNSATFYFEDGSFIRTQLYAEQYADYQVILDYETNPWPLPAGFYDGLRKVQSLADDKIVRFTETGFVVRDANKLDSGSFDIEGLKPGLQFNIEYLLLLEPIFKQVHFDVSNNKTLFFGDDIKARGAIMGLR